MRCRSPLSIALSREGEELPCFRETRTVKPIGSILIRINGLPDWLTLFLVGRLYQNAADRASRIANDTSHLSNRGYVGYEKMKPDLSVVLDHEKHRHLGAEAEVLGTLPNVELESRFALPRLVRR
jgi:hypothetical protein